MKICKKCGEEKPATDEYFNRHVTSKDMLRGECKSCTAEYNKKYRKDNEDKLARQEKEYRNNNKDNIIEGRKKYYSNNKDKVSVNCKKYAQGNKDNVNRINQAYRARKKHFPSTLTLEQWNTIKESFNNSCCYCGKEEPLAQEHFKPLYYGGEYTHNNIVPSCKSCNCSKGIKDFFDWYPKYKYYSKTRERKILKYLNYQNRIQQLSLI